MTVDERLAELLERATPEPPRIPTVADIERRSPSRPRRSWAPLVAAACVLALVLGVVVLTHRTDPPATTPTGHWRVSKLAGDSPPEYGPVLFGDGRQLYAYRSSPGGMSDSVERLSPVTGQPLAEHQLDRFERIIGDAALTNSYVVLPVDTRQGVQILLLGRKTLAVRAKMPTVPDLTGQDVRVASEGNTAYLAVGRRIAGFDLAQRTITLRYTVGSEVSALDLAHGQLYVGTVRGDVIVGPATRGGIQSVPKASGQVDSVIVTSGGDLWITASRRHHGSTVTLDGRTVAVSTGSNYLSAEESGGVVWLISAKTLACADPDTGHIRARSAQPRDSTIAPILTAGHHVLAGAAALHEPDDYLVQLHPPAACGG